MDNFASCDKILNSPEPLVIKGVLDWAQVKWTLSEWKTNLHEPDKKYPFRRGTHECSERPQWERTCQVVNLTIEEFFNLVDEEIDSKKSKYWYYFDYKHLEQWFNHNISLKDISWSCLGLDDVPSSTIWIGSKGAHTPCHFDTYGHNLIAQLYGKKMWILFPPSMTDKLKPCRTPYEESSVYSNINFACGCADLTGLSEARFVILEPGDILYVPKNWWHYVENLTTAVSINTWLPKKCDNTSRLEESLAKCLVISFLKDMPQTERDCILNPNEDDLPSSLNLDELTYCWKHCNDDSTTSTPPAPGKLFPPSTVSDLKILTNFELHDVINKKCSKTSPRTSSSDKTVQLEHIINAFCHPEVLELARKKLKLILDSS